MDEPRSVTLTTTLAVCGIIAGGLFTAKTAFAAPGWVWLAGALFLALAVTAALAQSSAGGRDYLTGTLRTRHYTQVYRYVARRLNDWVWRRVGRMRVLPDGTEAPPPETTHWFHLLRTALTWRLLDRALLIAVAYPVLALILPWLLGGEAMLGAGLVIFPAAGFWSERALFLALSVILTVGFVCAGMASVSSRRSWRRVGYWSPIFAAGFAVAFSGAIAGAGAVVFAGAIAVFVLGFALFVLVGASPGTVLFAGAGAVAFTFAFSFAVAGAVVVAFLGAFAVDWLWARGRLGMGLGLLGSFWAAGLLGLVLFVDLAVMPADGKALVVFLAVLPLINGLYDALSYAITLALSRKGLSTRWAPLWGLADLALGAVLFLALGATMVAVIAVLNAIGTAQIYDLAALFEGLRTTPGDYWWLYLILFSTLAPTALHILVAALAVQGWVAFQRARRAVARWTEAAPVSHPAAVKGCLFQALIWWLPLMALAALGWALWQITGTAAGATGLFYLDRLEGLARWIGAI